VKSDGKLSVIISINGSVRHGDSLSPLLFNFVMNDIIKNSKDKKGYRMGNKEVNIIFYADDAVLIAGREENLQRLLHQFIA
jgi:hypothetical protein